MLPGYIALSIILTLTYAAIMALYGYGWRQLPAWEITAGFVPRTKVSVVIPARNEAHRIGACLQSVLAVRYPSHLLEVLVVDDFSEDRTAEAAQAAAEVFFDAPRRHGGTEGIEGALEMSQAKPALKIRCLAEIPPPENMPVHGKKRAIQTAVAEARGELIVTTDADCEVPPDWLLLLASAYEKHQPKAIAAPVMIRGERNLLQVFQALDVAGTMGLTGAGIRLGWQHLGNGANLAYPKATFEAVGGFAGNAHQPSGDDVFLLQKIARRWPGEIFFLKNAAAAVQTPPAPDGKAFFQQRLRWGAKNAALPETPVRLVLAAVFLFCCSILLNAMLSVFYAAFGYVLAAQILVKAACDYALLREMCRFFDRRRWLRRFWPAFALHTVYIVLMGMASLFWQQFEWKGRRSC